MSICEYYCPENHTIYQFRAKTPAQEKIIPACPENPEFHLLRMTAQVFKDRKRSESLDETRGGEAACHMPDPDARFGAASEGGRNFELRRARRRGPMLRDPKLHDYP